MEMKGSVALFIAGERVFSTIVGVPQNQTTEIDGPHPNHCGVT